MPSATSPIRLLIAGGGTGGHVLPAVALIEEIRRRNVPIELLWIGGHTGVERDIALANDIPFAAIQTGKLRRYVSARTLVDAFRIPIGIAQAMVKVRSFRPDVIYSTGGAVSVPTAIAGRRAAPILTHEQTAQIGIANKTVAKFATTFCVGFEETAVAARERHGNVVVTGNPVRASLTTGDANRGRSRYGFETSFPVVYITGGARGASPLNQRVEGRLESLLEVAQVVHQVGPTSANDDFARLSAVKSKLPAHLAARYCPVEFVGAELADIYAMTDIVIARAGAGTVSELGYLGLPSVLIPLPGTWGDEQRKNARVLSSAGAAVVLEQADTDSNRLFAEVERLLSDSEGRRVMGSAARSTSRPDAAANLADELLKLANRNR